MSVEASEPEPAADREARAREVVERVRRGEVVADEAFDVVWPPSVEAAAWRHFTPLEVIARALDLLEVGPATRVLDAGAGAGKLCLVGALRTPGTFFGIEQRASLVAAGNEVARRHGIERASLVAGDMATFDWSPFDRLYYYNPFLESRLAADEQLSDEVALSQRVAVHLVRAVRAKLYLAPVGTRVVTFHGLGAPLPSGYRRVAAKVVGQGRQEGPLECWVREGWEATSGTGCESLDDCRSLCRCGLGRFQIFVQSD